MCVGLGGHAVDIVAEPVAVHHDASDVPALRWVRLARRVLDSKIIVRRLDAVVKEPAVLGQHVVVVRRVPGPRACLKEHAVDGLHVFAFGG